MKILITGATGFIGKQLVRELFVRGHEIVILSRHPELAMEGCGFPIQAYGWKSENLPPREAFAGVEAVFHLAGEPIASHRWNAAEKEKILKSRVLGTKNLLQAIENFKPPMQFLMSSSAIGIYGDRGDEQLTEASRPGSGFLAEVCEAWERELFAPALDPAIRRVALRTGIVLGSEGGMLKRILPIFRAGVGGRVGSGKQWMSWITLADLVQLMIFALENPKAEGVLNGTAPHPVTASEFAQTLAVAVGKRARFPAPALAIKTALGEMSAVLLSGQKVLPEAATRLGYSFRFSRLDEALRAEFSRPAGREGSERFLQEQWIPKPRAEVFDFFSNARNLEVITPPWLNFTIRSQSTPEIQRETTLDYRITIHNIPVQWRTLIRDWQPPEFFSDVQLKGPYALWEHEHHFTEHNGGTLMRDEVLYRVPAGALGRALAGYKIRKDIEEIFAFRLRKIRKIFD